MDDVDNESSSQLQSGELESKDSAKDSKPDSVPAGPVVEKEEHEGNDTGNPLEKEPRLYEINTDEIQAKNEGLLTLDELARGIRLRGGVEYQSGTSHSYPNLDMSVEQASAFRAAIGASLGEIYEHLGVGHSSEESQDGEGRSSIVGAIRGRLRRSGD